MLKDERSLILAATPLQSAELRTIFSDHEGTIRRRFENPPRLRDAGWDLPSKVQAEFLQGELIRVVERGRIVVDLYRDGTLVLGAQVDRNFLAWSDVEDLQLHPLALIELTTNFARFYTIVLNDFASTPKRVNFKIALQNMHLKGRKTRLGSGPVATWQPLGMGGMEAPADTWSKDLVVSSKAYNPDLVAFALIRELYLWFGHPEEAIPYTKLLGDGKVIDADQIAVIR